MLYMSSDDQAETKAEEAEQVYFVQCQFQEPADVDRLFESKFGTRSIIDDYRVSGKWIPAVLIHNITTPYIVGQ